MTVIAYKDGIVAADGQSTSSDGSLRTGVVAKLARGPNGEVLALMGCSLEAQRLRRWYVGGKKGKQPDGNDGHMVVIFPDRVENYIKGGVDPAAKADFYAWGVGRELAMGAMAAGASAERAVEIAIRFSVYCGDPMMCMVVGLG